MLLLGRKISGIIVFILIIICVHTNFLEASWWDKGSIPVPSGSQEVKKDVRRIAGSELEFTFYTSSAAPGSIREFYLRNLANAGWQENRPMEAISKFPQMQSNPDMMAAMQNNLSFKKDDGSIVIINFLPERLTQDKKTHFTVCQGKMDFNKPVDTTNNYLPELVAKLKKDVAPLYPGASLISLSEQARSLKAGYVSRDGVDQIMNFYKDKMVTYDWSLTDETPINKINAQDFDMSSLSQSCPACADKAKEAMKITDMLYSELIFSNARQDQCKVGFYSVVSALGAEGSEMNFTTIMLDYQER